jgi:hypothetical protein
MQSMINKAGVTARRFYSLNVLFLKTKPQIKFIKIKSKISSAKKSRIIVIFLP